MDRTGTEAWHLTVTWTSCLGSGALSRGRASDAAPNVYDIIDNALGMGQICACRAVMRPFLTPQGRPARKQDVRGKSIDLVLPGERQQQPVFLLRHMWSGA